MNCTLCERPIKDFDPSLSRLKIDDTHSADICPECIDKIMRWQGSVYARLFPTSAMKKRFGGGRK